MFLNFKFFSRIAAMAAIIFITTDAAAYCKYPYDPLYWIKRHAVYMVFFISAATVIIGSFWYDLKNKGYKSLIEAQKKQIDNYEDELGIKQLSQKEREKAGREYEEHIAKILRRQNWEITYNGIIKGINDEGIDLIGQKNSQILLVQCKNWKADKLIGEKTIFAFEGACRYFQSKNKEDKIKKAFYSSCPFSDSAKKVAAKLNIEIHDNFKNWSRR